jgi:hypothetical protein
VNRRSLRPGPRAGLEVAEARDWRIDVSPAGGVVVRRPGKPDTVVAEPGQVARVVLVRDAQVPSTLRVPSQFQEVLAVLGDDRVLVAVPLPLLAHGKVTSAEDLRRVAGADDFALSLGLSLEPATDADAALVARADGDAVQLGPVRPGLRRALLAHLGLLALAALALVAAVLLDGTGRGLAGCVAAAALLVLSVDQWRRRSSFLRLVAPVTPQDRTVVRPAGAGRATNVPQLQIGTQDVVHHADGWETWIAGPALGGVTRCVAGDDVVAFRDRRDATLLAVPAAPWGADLDELAGACRRAGIDFRRAGTHAGTALDAHVPSMSLGATGEVLLVGPLATSVLAVTVAVGLLFPLDDLDVPRLVGAVAAVVAAVLSAGAQLRHRRWLRRHPGVVA